MVTHNRWSLVFLAVLTLLFGSIGYADTNLVANSKFQNGETIDTGLPTVFRVWAGDTTSLVEAENGITPFKGRRMLRFDKTFFTVPTERDSSVWQLIEVSRFSNLTARGRLSVSASARFNRVDQGSTTDTEFVIEVQAFGGVPATFPFDVNNNFVANARATFNSDSDTATWESLGVELVLPAGTQYIGVALSAVEDVVNDSSPPEFAGHFADDVVVKINLPPDN